MKRLALASLALAAACSSSDTDLAGNYTVALTNGDNGCNLMNFTPGQSSSGIAVTITQQGSDATLDVGGVAAVYLNALLGAHTYTGSVDGSGFDLEVLGNVPRTMGNCTYTYNSSVTGKLDGDTLTGKITYTGAGNGNPDCATITGCTSVQDFNGTRPPQ